MPRHEFRARHYQHVFKTLATYINGGHPVTLQTTHGERDDENCITFAISDWSAFVAVLEPEAGQR